ncbi:response regulator [Alicyclobacillus suci]|uniref:response regulator n=1 Tax=Alicyclobacillus suci TaxID=2816080 RepID=UPI001A8E37FD|nr:response regulator transcription factor [Alicyclobacillus suci]
MGSYKILIADDNARSRSAIRLLLNSEPLFQVVADAKNGEEAIVFARQHVPDLVLMDINMPGMNGFEATRQIKQMLPNVRIVILSVSDDAADLFEAIRNGAQGYLIKSLRPSDWITYLHGVLDGETPLPREMAERLLSEFRTNPTIKGCQADNIEKLTNREREILELVSRGATNREIANALFIAENTVKNHLKNIMAKLHIQNRVQLATYVRDKRLNKES